MRTRKRRIVALFSTVALLASVGAVLLPITAASAATVTNPNACSVPAFLSPDPFELPVTLAGTATPDPVDVGDPSAITLTATVTVFFPGSFIDAGIGIGALNPGDTIPADVTVEILGSNTDEGTFSDTQAVLLGPITVDPGTGLANPASATLPLASSTWTATSGGPVDFAQGDLLISADVGFPNPIPVTCAPGTVSASVPPVATFGPAAPYASTTAEAPPAPPDAVDDSANVGGGQSVFIDVLDNDSDQNGDLDPSTLAVPGVTGTPVSPAEGTAVVSSVGPDLTPSTGDDTPGVLYTHGGGANPTDTFTYEVNDVAGLGPSQATVDVSILGNLCDATSGPCTLDQVIDVDVIGTTLTMAQAGSFVTLGAVTLNGEYQVTTGAIQPITVTNARGTDAMWDLTGQVTDFVEGTSGLADCSTPSNRCIPGDNLGWAPSASIAHTVIPGDVAAVAPGASLSDTAQPWLDGLSSSARDLCTTAATTSGGTFLCEAGLYLAVPASAAAGNYTGTMTFTLA